MLITVFDKYFLRIDILTNFTFAQYEDKYDDIGTFSVEALIDEQNKKFLNKKERYFLHFENGIMGRIERVNIDYDSDPNIINLSGRLLGYIMEKRVIRGIKNAVNAYAAETIRNTFESCFRVTGLDKQGRINFVTSYGNVVFNQTSIVTKQQTGGTLWKWIQPLLQMDELGYDMTANIGERQLFDYESGGAAFSTWTNVASWNFELRKGVDRTKGNAEGNKPVIFDTDLSNLKTLTYDLNVEDHTTCAIVAGEGEGTDRRWVEKDYHTDEVDLVFGWNWEEIYVDARDVQSEEGQSQDEYDDMLYNRADEKAKEADVIETYSGTVRNDGRYFYGKDADFWKGDIVTLVDRELGISIDARITSVIHSVQGSEDILDLVFGYQEVLPINKLKKEGVV